ncbi:MAG: hypothetical protein Q8P19_00180 [bacterium]|nr:hypothetical protein [bacterium]
MNTSSTLKFAFACGIALCATAAWADSSVPVPSLRPPQEDPVPVPTLRPQFPPTPPEEMRAGVIRGLVCGTEEQSLTVLDLLAQYMDTNAVAQAASRLNAVPCEDGVYEFDEWKVLDKPIYVPELMAEFVVVRARIVAKVTTFSFATLGFSDSFTIKTPMSPPIYRFLLYKLPGESM